MQYRQFICQDFDYDGAEQQTGWEVGSWDCLQIEAGRFQTQTLRPQESLIVMAGSGRIEGGTSYRAGTSFSADSLGYLRFFAERDTQIRRGFDTRQLELRFSRQLAVLHRQSSLGSWIPVASPPETGVHLIRRQPGPLTLELSRLGMPCQEVRLEELASYRLACQGPLGPQRVWVEYLDALPLHWSETLIWSGERSYQWVPSPHGRPLHEQLRQLGLLLQPPPLLNEFTLHRLTRSIGHWRQNGVWAAAEERPCLSYSTAQRARFPIWYADQHQLACARVNALPVAGEPTLRCYGAGLTLQLTYQSSHLYEEWGFEFYEDGELASAVPVRWFH